MFVYGTLMKGLEGDWQNKVGARLVGRGRVKGKLYDLGEYPGAVYTPGESDEYVKGELYEVNDPELATRILDRYEEFFPTQPHRSLFVRTVAPVLLEDGRRENAWVYVYNQPVDEANLIPGGDYRERTTKKDSQRAR